MANLAAKMLIKLVERLVTEKFFGRMAVLILEALSQYTGNKITGDICKAVGDALDNPCKP